MNSPRDIVVIGGGFAGLGTAALLAHSGLNVTLVERHDQIGGRAGIVERDGFRFDAGPSWYFMPEVFEHYFALLGERIEDYVTFRTLSPSYRVFPEPASGETVASPVDIGPPHKIPAQLEAIQPGSTRAVRRYVTRASRAYRHAVDRFLYTTFERPWTSLTGKAILDLPVLAPLLTRSLAAHVAKSVDDIRLQQVLSYHAVFLGSSPYRVPALYSLMSHLDLAQAVRHPVGGMNAVVNALAQVAQDRGVTIRTGDDVRRILVTGPPWNRSVSGVELVNGEHLSADAVVSTADLYHTETQLIEPRDATYPKHYWTTKDAGVSALLIYAGVRGELPQLAHHSLFFTKDWPSNFEAILPSAPGARPTVPLPGSLYVSKVTATEAAGLPGAAAPSGHEALVILVPIGADVTVGTTPSESLDQLADLYIDQVAHWAGIPNLAERIVTRHVVGPADFAASYSAWQGGALGMEHTLRQSAMFRPQGVSKRVSGLYYAGASVAPGIGVPMCLISAELVLKRLRGDTSATPTPTPLPRGCLVAAEAAPSATVSA